MDHLDVELLLDEIRVQVSPRELRGDSFGGLHPRGWPDETWILHPMWEREGPRDDRTHDDVYKADAIASLPDGEEFDALREIAANAILTGERRGSRGEPTEGWRRLLWRQFIERVGHTPQAPYVIPSGRWFEFVSWPAAIESPCVGSMDRATTLWIISLILERIPIYHSEDPDPAYLELLNVLFAGEVSIDHRATAMRCEIREFPDTMKLAYPTGSVHTPTNIWPEDASWMIWTPTEGMGTLVSGPPEFVESVRRCEYFETAQIALGEPRPGSLYPYSLPPER